MQAVYPHDNDSRHRAFTDFPQIQHASWSSQQQYIAHNGEIMNTTGLPNFSSRQTDYVQNGQVHYGADNDHSPLYASPPVSPRHDCYQNDVPDDAYLRQQALNSFPESPPSGYEVEGLRFNEGCRDNNGQLLEGQYWELSSYCIPALFDHGGHYNPRPSGLAGPTSQQQQYDTPYGHHGSESHASTTIPQSHYFDGHAGSQPVQTHSRSNSLPHGHDGTALLEPEPAVPVAPQQYPIDERAYGHGTLENVLTPVYHDPAPTPSHMLRYADHHVVHQEARSDAYPRAHRHSHRDTHSMMYAMPSPSPPLKRLASKDSSDGHTPPSRARLEKSPSRRQQEGPFGPVLPNQSVLKLSGKKNADKKQTLACLFCRERKIACGRPAEGSPDHTCNQCARRQFKCEYPKESRRGQHKRGRRKAHDVNDAN